MTLLRSRWMAPACLISATLVSLRGADAPSSADAISRGKTFFAQNCALCHAVTLGPDGQPVAGQGPGLAGVLGRPAASLTNFNYTRALSASGLHWDAATLDRFLTNPSVAVPGTMMPIVVPDPQTRQDLIAYLRTLQGPSGAVAARGNEAANAAAGSDAADWRHDSPGTEHYIDLARLPAPYATPSAGNGPRVVDPPEGSHLAVPAGFEVKTFAAGLSGPRLLRVAPNGDLFVAETKAGRIKVLRAKPGAEQPDQVEVFAEHLDGPFGIAFYPRGENPEWVYIANNNSVIRFPYRNGDLRARGAAETIVPQLCNSHGGHSTRDIVFSPDGTRLYISVGSGSNVAEGMTQKSADEIKAWEAQHGRGASWDFETNRALILVTTPDGKAPLRSFATGVRNGVGLGVNPWTGDVWVSTNERDGLGDNLVPDYITHLQEGGYYGWPWYYYGSHEDPRHAGERPDLRGAALVPDVPLQAHSAALEFAFYTAIEGAAVFPKEYRGDVYLALHGSWNRASRTGYKVVRVRLENGKPTGRYEDFLTGFVVDDRSVWGRPVGVAVAQDGALLVSEDGNGTIWRVAYRGR